MTIRYGRIIIIIIFMIISVLTAIAGASGEKRPALEFSKIDALFESGLKEYHYHSNNLSLKQSLDLCLELMKKYPNDYDVLWRYARSAGIYAESLIGLQPAGWEDICEELGKKGETIALKAEKIKPGRVEAYAWQISCTGSYGFVCGLFTAVREGLHNKLRKCMERSCQIDKTYCDYYSVLSLSLYYYNMPWPLKDKKKALQYYKEFIASAKNPWMMKTRQVESADVLLGLDDDYYTKIGRQYLNEALAVKDLPKYYRDKAIRLRNDLD